MKRLLLLILLLTGICSAQDFTFTGMADYNQFGLRLGRTFGRLELGFQSYWWENEDRDPPQTYGGYGLYELPEPLNLGNLPLFNLLPLDSATYVGFQGAIEINSDHEQRGYYGPIAGLSQILGENMTTGVEAQFVQYTDRWEDLIEDDELRVTYYFKIRF